jgi:hypothetical protein
MKQTISRWGCLSLAWLGGAWLCSEAQAAIDPNDCITGLVYAQSNYLAVGYSGAIYPSTTGVAFVSMDGSHWIRLTNNLSLCSGLAWGNGKYVAFGGYDVWNSSGNWRFDSYFQTSADGTNWVRQETGLPWRLNRILFADGRFVAVGDQGSILTSTDGLSWSYPSSGTEYNLKDIAYGQGQFVVVGASGAILTSTNGLDWTNHFAGAVADMYGVVFESGQFVAVATSWLSWPYVRVYASLDGVTWTNTYQDPIPYYYYYVDRIFSGNGRFLIPDVGNGTLVSTNGVNWQRGNFWNIYVNDVVYLGDRFFASGNGAILTSADGSSWLNPALSNAPPSVVFRASTNELFEGQTFGQYVAVDGNPFPQCQWQFNGADLPDAKAIELRFWGATTNQAGEYRLVASNLWGMATSEVLTVTVKRQAPVVTGSPVNQTVLADNSVTIAAAVEAGPPAVFQWFYNDQAIAGATNINLSLGAVSIQQAGQYYLVASNALGVATSQVATLIVDTLPPTIATQPMDQIVPAGAKVSFYCFANGAPSPQYYLFFNGANLALPARYGNTFTLLEASTNDAGGYVIIASNSVGTATSRVATLTITPAGPLDSWQRRNPLPQGNNLLSVTYGDGQFVAVGERGAIVTSTNATNWVVQSLRTDVDLNKVVYGQGQYIAVGDYGNILGSTDGKTWGLRRIEEAGLWFNSVAFGNGLFVAVAYTSSSVAAIWTSANGLDWTPCALPNLISDFTDVVWGNGRFVAVSGSRYVGVSTNGVDWDIQDLGDYGLTSRITFGKGRFVAVGNNGLATVSGDGYSWTLRPFGSVRRFLGVAYGNNLFVTVGTRGTIYTSPDGAAWTARNSTTPDRLESVVYANQMFVALGENGTTLTSADGITWVKQNLGTVRDLDGMTLGDGLVVIAGKYGTILTSADGRHFTQQTTGITNDLHGVAYANGQYVAVGDEGHILVSTNGLQWTSQNSGETNSSLKRAAWGNGLWVAVGTGGTILTSPDASNWRRALSPTGDDLNEAAYGNGTFVIVGDHFPRNATILASTDGSHWTNQIFYTGKNMRAVTFANGLFLATGNDGVIAVSTNGANWSFRYSGIFYNGGNLRGVNYANGLWIIVGNDGIILTSTDTFNWSTRAANAIENLHGVQLINGSLVTIGNRGNIFQSGRLFGPALAAPAFHPQTGFSLTIQGQLGYSQRLQASPDLREWTDVLLLSDTQGVANFVDQAALLHARRYYRIVSP